MPTTPPFLDSNRPDVPDIVVPRGVTPFYLPNRPVRGRLVRLGPLADALLTRHPNPPVVTHLAAQALALVAALATALKFRGSFSVQAKSDGPVPVLVADCTEAGALRFYVRSDATKLATLLASDPAPDAAALLGEGYLAFTVDQGQESERYQGIVQIEGSTLADMAVHYFESSEQIPCALWLAAAQTAEGWRAASLVLERVAAAGGTDGDLEDAEQDESWHTATALAATIKDSELLDDGLPAEELIWRLFSTEGAAVDRPRALAFGCRCSRQRLWSVLEGFAPEDLDHMAVDGDIVMTCEFCNLDFRFAREDVRSSQ